MTGEGYHGGRKCTSKDVFLIQVINKPDFLETSDCGICSHFSFLNNTVDVYKLDILIDNNDLTHSEANTSDLERFIN